MSYRKKKAARRRIPVEIVIILVLILGVGLAGGLWYFVVQPSIAAGQGDPLSAGEPVAESSEAPDFVTMDLNGNTVRLGDYQGQPVVLNAWATWCAPCRAEMPDLDKLYQEHKDQGVVVLAVNIGEPRDRVAEFIRDNGYTFPVLLDESTAAIAQPYRIRAVPTTFFIDREGQIASIRVGAMSLAEMKRRLADILSTPQAQ